ncbi:hypothetical protein [Streptomyces sp. OE57]|uniref:hypothetical protein n=1 Tax=Streptomyces lacaronensis TaxID=3379885 RepID=UPI0039B768FC
MIEYTARRELEHVAKDWKCLRHAAPDEWMTPSNRETTAVLELQPRYLNSSRSGGEPRLLGYFWGPPGQRASHGSVSGPGFQALADNFPPGTRLTVTATITLPEPPEITSSAADPQATANPAGPTAGTVRASGDAVPVAGDTVEDTVLAVGGRVRIPVPGDGTGCDLTSGVPVFPHPEDTGDAGGDRRGDGVRFAYTATVRRGQVPAAITEAFQLLDRELHPHRPELEEGPSDA